jgi:uncharacterized protein YjbI with pentapeptide repeats
MKYVITMTDGEYGKPVPMDEFLKDNEDAEGFAEEAMHDWLQGKPYISGGGPAPQFINFLVELPAWAMHYSFDGSDLSSSDLRYSNLSCSNLGGSDLRYSHLRYSDLSGRNLSGRDLSSSDLRYSNLSCSNLSGSDLSCSNLSGSDLSGSDLSGSDLSGSDLRYSNLSGCDLGGCDLGGSDLSGSDLGGCDLSGSINAGLPVARTIIVPEGQIIGWKKLGNGAIAKLSIPADARRSNASGRKCRAEFADVLEIFGAESGMSTNHAPESLRIEYRAGIRVTCNEWDANRFNECSGGIHFYITRTEAEAQ